MEMAASLGENPLSNSSCSTLESPNILFRVYSYHLWLKPLVRMCPIITQAQANRLKPCYNTPLFLNMLTVSHASRGIGSRTYNPARPIRIEMMHKHFESIPRGLLDEYTLPADFKHSISSQVDH
ncbi:hypothetical protein VNO77_03497 [Canavalia gladiata]|uniref:Uncharacterized protein n=1 Tax=Canavalia gladiata TaxID=3824 RepID=A0AAN9N0H0_CANGL